MEEEQAKEDRRSAWETNPEGLAGKIRKIEEERKKMAAGALEAIRQRRSREDTHREVPARVEEGKIKIDIPEEIIERNARLWEHALVGRFTGPRPELDKIRQWATQRWKVTKLEITALPKGCVLINFQNEEEMLGVLLRAPWFMEGKGLLMEKWHEGFNPKDEDSKLIPVWVQVPGLPLQAWDEDVIRGIATAIGKLVAIDTATKNRTRLIHARFCVLVEADKQVPENIELKMGSSVWAQDLVYEESRGRCPKCRQGKHIPQKCPGRGETEQKEATKKEWAPKRQAEDKGNKEVRNEKGKAEGGEQETEATEEAAEPREEEKVERENGEETEEAEKEQREEQEEKEDQAEAESAEEEPEEFEKVQTRGSRRLQAKGRMDLGIEEKKMGRPTDKERREKEAASQIDMGIQRTLVSTRGKGKSRK